MKVLASFIMVEMEIKETGTCLVERERACFLPVPFFPGQSTKYGHALPPIYYTQDRRKLKSKQV